MLYTPGPRSAIEQVATGRDAAYAAITDNVAGAIHAFSPKADGTWGMDKRWRCRRAGRPMSSAANDWGPEAQFGFESYLQPTTLYAYDGSGEPQPIKSLPARFDAAGLVTEQFEAISQDGTKIPYFITHRKDAGGPVPTILYGYGGFEISLTPSYSANFGKLWLAQGGAYVVANIRGGGEFGPAWHEAALKENRQRAFDDFAAVAADLERRGFTTPNQLGIMGGSNGGLLVSTVMVQHPDLAGRGGLPGAADRHARLYPYRRRAPPGPPNMAIPPIRKMRAAILKYSPYQNVNRDTNISAGVLRHRHLGRPRDARACAQDGREDGRPGP